MYSRDLKSPEEEWEDAKKLLEDRFKKRMDEIGLDRPPSLTFPLPGMGGSSRLHVQSDKAERRQELQEERRIEFGNLEKIRQTEDLSDRTAAQIARDALVPRPEKSPVPLSDPSHEFKVQATPQLFDKSRVDIENEAMKDDPPARAWRAAEAAKNEAQVLEAKKQQIRAETAAELNAREEKINLEKLLEQQRKLKP